MDWRAIVGTVAPALATALGGPLAGVAVKALSSKLLGKEDGTQDEVGAAIAAMSPADLVKLKEVEADLTKALAAVDVDMERIAAGDRDSARRRATESRDWTPSILTVLLYGMLFYVIHRLVAGFELKGDAQVLYMILGSLVTEVGRASSFQFGTTRNSGEKDKTLSALVRK